MADEPNRKNYDEIRHDLVRTAIKQPLLTMVRDPNNKDRKIRVIIEANHDYYAGKDKAEEEVRRLVQEIAGVDTWSIGSAQNPYYKTSLTPQQILDIIDQDDNNAFQ